MDGFQHEQPDYWLNFGNPWELERLNVAYPISYYGHVSVHEEGGRQIFKWNPGEPVRGPASEGCQKVSRSWCVYWLRCTVLGCNKAMGTG